MDISIEVSYYPLKQEFIPSIQDFIDRLNAYSDLTVRTNGMSTQIFGEYDHVFNAVQKEIRKSFEVPHSIFVMKVINADLQTVPDHE